MNVSVISDYHIKHKNDQPYQLVSKFLEDEGVLSSKYIFFLGDIFDLMVGNNKEYYFEYEEIFKKLKKLMDLNKEIHFFEGNHDFHLENFFGTYFEDYIYNRQFFYHKKYQTFKLNKYKIFVCHGDDMEIGNYGYKMYSKWIKSFPMNLLADYVIPYEFIKVFGEFASKSSRKRNLKKEHLLSKDFIKEKFRKSAEKVWRKTKVDYIMAGHSHCKDLFRSKLGFTYINNGHGPSEKTFIQIDLVNGDIKFRSIV